MNDPKRRSLYLQMAETDITSLMQGDQPRLIDEWQDAPQFWDAIRYDVDHSEGFGHYILTGSAVPPDEKDKNGKEIVSHTGTGRISRLTMRPMSLWESKESSGSVSFRDLFDGSEFKTGSGPDLELREVAHLVCRGGWPQAVQQEGARALRRAYNYYDAVVNVDISRVDKTIRDPERVKRLMRSYAKQRWRMVIWVILGSVDTACVIRSADFIRRREARRKRGLAFIPDFHVHARQSA